MTRLRDSMTRLRKGRPVEHRKAGRKATGRRPCMAGCGKPSQAGHELCGTCMEQALMEDEEPE